MFIHQALLSHKLVYNGGSKFELPLLVRNSTIGPNVGQILCLKAGANNETLLQKQKCIQDAKNVFEKFQKHFLLSTHRFCVFNMCCAGEQTSSHLGNTEETLTLNVS